MSLWGVVLETWGWEGMGKGQTHKCTCRKAGVRWVLLTLWSGTTENLSSFIAYSLGRELSPGRRCQQASSLRLESSRRRKSWLPGFVHIVSISTEPGKGFTAPPSLWVWPRRKALPVFHRPEAWVLDMVLPKSTIHTPSGLHSVFIHSLETSSAPHGRKFILPYSSRRRLQDSRLTTQEAEKLHFQLHKESRESEVQIERVKCR